MADVFPARNLPGEAENWGRSVERRISDRESAEVQLNQAVMNMGRATSGQLAVLSRQVQDLVGRVGYSATSFGLAAYGAGVWDETSRCSISFSLDRPRAVHLIITSVGVATSTVSLGSQAYLWYSLNGSVQMGGIGPGFIANGDRSGFFRGSLVSSFLLNLAAGTHTIGPAYQVIFPAGTSSMSLGDINMTVNVLQPLTQ